MLREGLQKVRDTFEDVERAIRRKMRVYPPLTPATAGPRPAPPAPRGREAGEEQRRYQDAERKAIVSLYGRDLNSEQEIAGGRPEEEEEAA
jgi:hypothetical protein